MARRSKKWSEDKAIDFILTHCLSGRHLRRAMNQSECNGGYDESVAQVREALREDLEQAIEDERDSLFDDKGQCDPYAVLLLAGTIGFDPEPGLRRLESRPFTSEQCAEGGKNSRKDVDLKSLKCEYIALIGKNPNLSPTAACERLAKKKEFHGVTSRTLQSRLKEIGLL